jgi:catechol 2,3-dioxygenase-like lactoylglutathione lyase family enzyme
MRADRLSTMLLCRDVAASRDFYADLLGFRVTTDIGWFVSLEHETGSFELCLIDHDHESLPEAGRVPVAGVGLALMVADARAEEARLRDAGVPIAGPCVDEPWGQRHFFATDPAGALVDVVEQIAPDPEWMTANGFG